MKLKCIDTLSGRSDAPNKRPNDITVGVEYDVAEVLETQYAIINDIGKFARYSKYRFEVIDLEPPKPLNKNFNMLTRDIRMELKACKKSIDLINNGNKIFIDKGALQMTINVLEREGKDDIVKALKDGVY